MPRNECTWIVLTDCFVPRHDGTFLWHPDEATIVLESPVSIAGIKLIVTLVLNNKKDHMPQTKNLCLYNYRTLIKI